MVTIRFGSEIVSTRILLTSEFRVGDFIERGGELMQIFAVRRDLLSHEIKALGIRSATGSQCVIPVGTIKLQVWRKRR